MVLSVTEKSGGMIEIRFIYRDANLELMNAHLTGTSMSIPKLIQLDTAFNVLDSWGPRPEKAQQIGGVTARVERAIRVASIGGRHDGVGVDDVGGRGRRGGSREGSRGASGRRGRARSRRRRATSLEQERAERPRRKQKDSGFGRRTQHSRQD